MGNWGNLFTGIGRDARVLGIQAQRVARKTMSTGVSAGWSAIKHSRSNPVLRRTLIGAGIGAGIGGVNAGIRGDNVLSGAIGGAGVGAASGFAYNSIKNGSLKKAGFGGKIGGGGGGRTRGSIMYDSPIGPTRPTSAPPPSGASAGSSRVSRRSYWGGMSQSQKRTTRAMSRSSANLPLSQRLHIYKNNKAINNRTLGGGRGGQTYSGSTMSGIPDWRMRG